LNRIRSAIGGIEWPAIPGNTGSSMLATLFQLERSQWLPAAEIWPHQRRQLRALLRHAAATVPYYRDRIAGQVGALADDFSIEDFARLPKLTRSDLQQSFDALCAQRLPPGHGNAMAGTTSGSTGEPVRYLATHVSNYFWQAFMLREHLWHRRDMDAKMLVIRVEKEPRVSDNWFGNVGRELLDTGPLVLLPAAWTFDRQLDRLLEEKPAYLLGYANNVLEIFRAAERRGGAMPWLREARVFGEAVSEDMRTYIRDRWNLPLSDVYTARETGYMAIQCKEHGAYHVQAESAFVEVLGEDGQPCGPGGVGRVVVTPLHGFALPLIRYEIGDYAEVGEPCPCGRGLPALRRIHGRRRNALTLPDGSKRWPTIGTTRLLDIAPIRRFKVVQKSLSDIEVRLIVARPLLESETAALRAHLTDQFGHPFNWHFVFLDEFPPQPGDKFEDFISEVS
jgi:phenylacetate-CoA ligase